MESQPACWQVSARFSGTRLRLFDPDIKPGTKKTLDAISPRVDYLHIIPERLPQSKFFADNARNISFVHIDGMHRFSAVISDLRACEHLLDEYGIISVDDFHTDLFPQIPAAVYKYLYSGASDLCIFLVGLNKAYLCRNIAKKYYMQFSREQLLPALERMGQKLTLVKTDRDDSFDAFSIAHFWEDRLWGSEHS